MIINTIQNAIGNVWPMLTIFLVVLITVRIAYLKTNNKEFVFYKEILLLVFVVYLLILFELVTNNEQGSKGLNLIPFTEIFRYSLSNELFIYNVVGNIVVFLPFGYFVSSYIKSKSIWQMVFISFITSLTVELVQYRIGRSFDVDDIILNIVGGVLGFLAYVGLTAIKKQLPEFFQKDFLYNLIIIILIVLVTLYYFGFSFGR